MMQLQRGDPTRLEILGTSLALDFANTINSRHSPMADYLSSYADLLAWSQRAGATDDVQVTRLAARATRAPELADAVLRNALELRELIYRVFAGLADGHGAAEDDLRALAAAYGEATREGRFEWAADHYEVSWSDRDDLSAPLWTIAHAAGELLRSLQLPRVKSCPGCGWLFVDGSKNAGRRWCNMQVCGSRDKMRRYHQRNRTGGDHSS